MSTGSQSLVQVFKSYRVNWYRCPIDRDTLRDLVQRSDVQGWLQAAGHLALAASAGALTYEFQERLMWVGFTLALFAHGTVSSHYLSACHELGHGTVFKTKWLNGLFLRLFSLLAWWNFHEYALSHTYHHVYTLHPRADKEVVLPKPPSLRPLYLLQLFTFNVTGGFESRGVINIVGGIVKTAFGGYGVMSTPGWLEALYADRPDARRRAVNWARFVLLFHVVVAAISFTLGLWIVPVLVSLGPAIGNWHRYFVGVPMHCGLRDNVPDFRKCVRTITLNPVSEFLYWHMNWHLEHHMFAAIPCYKLRKLHYAIANDMPTPRTLLGAWREMRETWHRQQVDPSYQFNTPVPQPAEYTSSPQAPEAASIGDLAPAELR